MLTVALASFYLAALGAWVLAVLLLSRYRASRFHRNVAGALLAIGLVQFAEGLSLLDSQNALLWSRLALAGEFWLASALLYVSLALTETAGSRIGMGVRWQCHVAAVVAGLCAGLAGTDLVLDWVAFDNQVMAVGRGPLGRVVYLVLILLFVLGIAHLESLLRLLREPLRYQLKFVLLGLGALAVCRIYYASEMLAVPVQQFETPLLSGVAATMALALVVFGFARSRIHQVTDRVYVSPQMLYGSVTFLAVGLYLLGVGLLSQIIRSTGLSFSEGLSLLVVFVALIALAAALLSRTVRAFVRTHVTHHFYRSKYDYRAKWLEVTDLFLRCDSVEMILDRLLDLLGGTFGAGRISIWVKVEADGRFHRTHSTNTEAVPSPLEHTHAVPSCLQWGDDLVEVGALNLSPADPFLVSTHAILCVPIRSDTELLAFVAMSREVSGVHYGQDDRDLLRAIGHHVGVLLAHSRMAEERRGLAELEALHRFSAFCLHDLKNLTARLSLVVQNAERHGRDPLFQESAMRTVTDTVHKMMALITKLSYKSLKLMPSTATEPVDVSTILGDLVRLIEQDDHLKVRMVGEPLPPVMGVREQLHQVLLNVLLNAKQAIGQGGEIVITQTQLNGSVVMTVADTGCGIPVARQRMLFRPTQSSKPGGLGIGLYQCKQTVEAHHGTIQIISTEGKGTEVRIELPLYPTPAVAHDSTL
jgi:putative PEP-CTERM system histidine kinase